MIATSRSLPRARWLVLLVAVATACAGCSSSPTKRPSAPAGAFKIPVFVPKNCKLGTGAAHPFVGLKATADTGLTEKQVAAAIPIPNFATMPCASGANYTPGPPVGVQIYFLHGATAANQSKSAATLRATHKFSSVTVVPRP